MATSVTARSISKVKLGLQGFEVSCQGLGCMGMSAFYGPPKPEEEMISLIRHAVSSGIPGIPFLDTSDLYGPFTNEILLGKTFPRFQADNLEKNKIAYENICNIASRKGCTPPELALAWVHHQGNDVVPIPGTTKVKNLEDNASALSVKLTSEEIKELENVVSTTVSGDRYTKDAMHTTWMFANTPSLSSWESA